ncbi:MAG: DUF507 family protein [Nitrospinae bacterium]|nr:DUF507 family protein [Nitrospinota bacterium]
MRLKKEMIDYLAQRIVTVLIEKGHIDPGEDTEGVCESISGVIFADLHKEDDLNDEVKAMLEKMGDELDRSQVDYRKMFQMVKQKLARERGIIL